MYSVVLSFAPSCSIPFFFFFLKQDTRFPRQLGLQSPGQLQISSAVGGLGGWEGMWRGVMMENGEGGEREGRRREGGGMREGGVGKV